MTRIQFGFTMPADQLDKARRATFVYDLDRALALISGHFDSAWIIDHLQFGDDAATHHGRRVQATDAAADSPARRLVERVVDGARGVPADGG